MKLKSKEEYEAMNGKQRGEYDQLVQRARSLEKYVSTLGGYEKTRKEKELVEIQNWISEMKPEPEDAAPDYSELDKARQDRANKKTGTGQKPAERKVESGNFGTAKSGPMPDMPAPPVRKGNAFENWDGKPMNYTDKKKVSYNPDEQEAMDNMEEEGSEYYGTTPPAKTRKPKDMITGKRVEMRKGREMRNV